MPRSRSRIRRRRTPSKAARVHRFGPSDFQRVEPTIDREHEQIFRAVDNLYRVCRKHWDTEERMFSAGLKKLPPGHKPPTARLASHRADHTNLLNSITAMKKSIQTHIATKDVEDFHWT